MKCFFTLSLLFHVILSHGQFVTNGDFSSSTTGWACGAEVSTENIYGGSTSNNVAEVDAAASLCQTINGFVVGSIYRLSIDYSRRTGSCPGPNPAAANITLNSSLNVSISSNVASYALKTSVFTFTALQTSLPLSIVANFSGTTCGLIIDNISISLFSALPIELVNFNATVSQKDVLVEWITASQTDNDFFTVERSSDAVHWNPIMEVDGEGTYLQHKSYSQLDRSPLDGLSYYRLKQTDFSKKMSYSAIVSVERVSGNINLYPNPVIDELNLVKQDDRQVLLQLFDPIGKEVPLNYQEDDGKHIKFNTSCLANGLYTLKITDSERESYKKIIINRPN